jgi:uncharacterized glyoxalase superfamily metalloenzyme YdcJ
MLSKISYATRQSLLSSRRYHVPVSEIRGALQTSLTKMYAKEVPLFTTLWDVVRDVNSGDLPEVHHGAVRCGTPMEYRQLADLFSVAGMYPVNYYNLAPSGIPVHSTGFRPIHQGEIVENPFRMFASLLRKDLFPMEVQVEIDSILAKREIIGPKLLDLIRIHKERGGLSAEQATDFVEEATKSFRRNENAGVSLSEYKRLYKVHPVVADIVAFLTPQLNHLTPEVNDIQACYDTMKKKGISVIPVIQGPPERKVPILLRQASFNAVAEEFKFPNGDATEVGMHSARFGEWETKGCAALTPKGLKLYYECLAEVPARESETNYEELSQKAFAKFPDDIEEMRKQGLVFLKYSATEKGLTSSLPDTFEALIEGGYVKYRVVPYQDFLPASAAGIFRSNVGNSGEFIGNPEDRKPELEKALGRYVLDSMSMYAAIEAESILATVRELRFALPKAKVEELTATVKNSDAMLIDSGRVV